MGDSEWVEVRRKKPNSVFNRLKFPDHQSLANDLLKISTSVYVSNFPSHLTVRELWNICGKKGTLADVFIANHKNKLGQMFGFCRFIKVVDSEDLVRSLNIIWIGKLRLHANVARFNRNVGVGQPNGPPKVSILKVVSINSSKVSTSHKEASYATVAKNLLGTGSKLDDRETNTPSIPIALHTPNGFPLALLGCFKDFWSIANTCIMCSSEGFVDVDFKYLGGLWVLFYFNTKESRDKFLNHKGVNSWFSILKGWHDDFVVEERLIWLEVEGVPIRAWDNEVFTKICGKWGRGKVLFMDDSYHSNRLSKRICIKSAHASLVFATIFVTLNNITYAIRVRELCSWTPTFLGNDSESDDSSSNGSAEEQGDNILEDDVVDSDAEIIGDDGQGADC
ncbi:reverse transcriptase domain, reverse transcriptase zinc-binding domain protein, partial [Tanacetum coccineum]